MKQGKNENLHKTARSTNSVRETKQLRYAVGYIVTNTDNFFRYDLNALTPGHIQLPPNSPMQNGSDTILTFYATLRSGKIIPKHILGTIYIKQQENILTNENIILELDDILAPDGRQSLTLQQSANLVQISLKRFPIAKVTTVSR